LACLQVQRTVWPGVWVADLAQQQIELGLRLRARRLVQPGDASQVVVHGALQLIDERGCFGLERARHEAFDEVAGQDEAEYVANAGQTRVLARRRVLCAVDHAAMEGELLVDQCLADERSVRLEGAPAEVLLEGIEWGRGEQG